MGKFLIRLTVLLALPMLLSGCLSHWFLETSSRLQVENATEDYTIVGVDVLSSNGAAYETWISEMILPGERSHVVEQDWVGDFMLRLRYTKSADGSGDTLQDKHKLELDGGSLFLSVKAEGDSLVYRFR